MKPEIRNRLALTSLLLVALLTLAPGASAAAPSPEKALELFLNQETAGIPGRVEVKIGSPDPRLRPAPCADLEPYIPAGSRLWGRSVLGVRCRQTVAGTPGWQILVPVEVRVFAPALVTSRALGAGESLTADSYRLQEVELTREPRGVLTDPSQIGDAVTARALAPGQTLRADALRARPVITAGTQVKVYAAGKGFRISTQGRALNAAAAGQTVRIQADSGRMLFGIAHPDGTVEVRL